MHDSLRDAAIEFRQEGLKSKYSETSIKRTPLGPSQVSA